jgi:catechol 2,3-dioxygenase-like lactoylglutathione lyase family enzyme
MKFNRLIPELAVSDLARSLDFYVGKLGFEIEFERPEDKFAFLSFEGSQLMLEQDDADGWTTAALEFPRGRGINFQIETDDLERIKTAVVAHEIPFFHPMKENWYRISDDTEEGVKEFLIQDVDGYLLRFQQFIGERKIYVED